MHLCFGPGDPSEGWRKVREMHTASTTLLLLFPRMGMTKCGRTRGNILNNSENKHVLLEDQKYCEEKYMGSDLLHVNSATSKQVPGAVPNTTCLGKESGRQNKGSIAFRIRAMVVT